MELIKTYNEDNLFKTQFTGSGTAILILLVLALIGLGERVLYDLARTFSDPIGDLGYFNNSKVIIVHAVFVVGLLILTVVVNYIFGRRREKYAIALIPYFLTSMVLAIQLAIQLGVYFTKHHNNLQFYLVMSLLVVVSSYGIFHIQNNYKKVRDTSQTNSTGLLAIFVVVFALFAVLILSFNNEKVLSNISQINNNYYPVNNSYTTTQQQNYGITKNYSLHINYKGGDFNHDMFLVKDNSGNISGNGGYPFGGNYSFAWMITSGQIIGQDIDFWAKYTYPSDGVSPQAIMHVVGVISSDGGMSGTWSDNYQGGSRAGNFVATLVR